MRVVKSGDCHASSYSETPQQTSPLHAATEHWRGVAAASTSPAPPPLPSRKGACIGRGPLALRRALSVWCRPSCAWRRGDAKPTDGGPWCYLSGGGCAHGSLPGTAAASSRVSCTIWRTLRHVPAQQGTVVMPSMPVARALRPSLSERKDCD